MMKLFNDKIMNLLYSKGNHEQNKIHSTEWEKYICSMRG